MFSWTRRGWTKDFFAKRFTFKIRFSWTRRWWTKYFFTKKFTFKIRFSWTRKEGELKISLEKDLHLRLGSLEQEKRVN